MKEPLNHRAADSSARVLSRRSLLRGGAAAVATAGSLSGPLWLDWGTASAGSLTMWAAKQLANGAVSYVGGAAFADVLGMVGVSSSDAKITAKLDQVLQQLDEMNRTLHAIDDQVSNLQRQLNVAQLAIQTHTSEEPLKAHVNALNRLFGTPSDSGAQSLAGLIVAARSGAPSDVASFSRRIDESVQDHIDGIHDALATTVAGNKSLLEQWADLLIAKLHRPQGQPDFGRLRQAYRLLESYFMQGLSAQFKGVALLAALYGVAGRYPDALNRARAGFFGTYHDQAERFLWSTERLVLSMTSVQSDADMANGPLEIFRRADVLTGGLTAVLAGQTNDVATLFAGTYGRILCRQSSAIEPGSARGLVRIDGIEVAGRMPENDSGIPWVEFVPSNGPYRQIAPSEQSQLKLVRVRRPFQSYPAMVASLPQSTPLTTPANGYVDAATLETTMQPTETTVRASAFVDRSRLNRGPGLQPAEHTVDNASVFSVTRGIVAQRGFSAVPETMPAVAHAVTIHLIRALRGDESLEQTFKQPLFTVAADEQFTLLVRGALLDYVVEPLYEQVPQLNNQMTLTLDGSDGSSIPIYNSSGSPIDVWDRSPTFTATAYVDNRVTVAAKPGVNYDLVARYVTKVRPATRTVAINERLDFQLGQVAIIRPPIVEL